MADTTLVPPAQDSSSTVDPNRPDHPDAVYNRRKAGWKMCRDLMEGTPAIQAEEDYLPRYALESDGGYAVRQKLVAVFPGYARTVLASAGMLLQDEPVLGDDMPEPLVKLWENIDNKGTHGRVFVWNLVIEKLVTGRCGVLSEYPRVENPSSLSGDEEQRLGLRPYLILVRAEDIIKARYQTVNGSQRLMLFIFREVSEEEDGKFGSREVTRYRVYRQVGETVTVEVWKKPREGEGTPTQEGSTLTLNKQTRIPFRPFGQLDAAPPLIHLAYLNLMHWRVQTEVLNIQGTACVPTPVRIGYVAPLVDGVPTPAPLILGTHNTIDIPGGLGNDVKFLSPDVSVLDPANKTLEDIKSDMGAAGLAFLAPDKRSAETAEAKRIDSAAQNATLATFANDFEDCVEGGFEDLATYMRDVKSGSVTVNTDFEGTVMDPAMVTALSGVVAQGGLSIDTLLMLMEKGKILPKGFDREKEIAKILRMNALPPERTPPTDNPPPKEG